MKVGALIVIEVHARDVVDRLIGAEVAAVNDFDWVAQMRYY
jgi:dynein heavy chain